MRLKGLFLVGLPVIFSFQALATPLVPAPPCPVASLATYIAMQGGTCNVGELGFTNFNFSVVPGAMGVTPISSSAVTVTPVFSAGGNLSVPRAGLSFSSPGFSVTGNQSVSYLLGYSIDPHPIIVNFDDVLDTFSPVFPGIASITTKLCIGGSFGSGTGSLPGCVQVAGSPPAFAATLNVFDNGPDSKKLFDTTGTFNPVTFINVQNTIQLSANGAKADFNKFSNSAGYIPNTLVPEPASFILIGGGLVILWRMSRCRASI